MFALCTCLTNAPSIRELSSCREKPSIEILNLLTRLNKTILKFQVARTVSCNGQNIDYKENVRCIHGFLDFKTCTGHFCTQAASTGDVVLGGDIDVARLKKGRVGKRQGKRGDRVRVQVRVRTTRK